MGRWLLAKTAELVGEAAVEGVAAVVSCLLVAGVVAAAVWGWRNHPTTTVGLGAVLVAALAYGTWHLLPVRRGKRRGRPAAIAVGLALAVGLWLSYVVSYCGCW